MRAIAIVVAGAAALAGDPAVAAGHRSDDDGWVSIFDGKTMAGWYTYQNKAGRNADNGVFKIEDGAFHVLDMPDGATDVEATGCLLTTQEYSNVRVRLQYRWGPKNYPVGRLNAIRERKDAGFLYYYFGPDNIWGHNLELQIQQGDDGDMWVNGSTSIVTAVVDPNAEGSRQWTPRGGTPLRIEGDVYPPETVRPARPASPYNSPRNVKKHLDWADQGTWNTLEVVLDGQHVQHYVNGHLVFDARNAMRRDARDPRRWVPLTTGKFCLEAEGSEVWYRNIQVKRLSR